MSPILTGNELYRKMIDGFVGNVGTPQEDLPDFKFNVLYVFNCLSHRIRIQREIDKLPHDEDVSQLKELIGIIPDVVGYLPEEMREDRINFLRSENLISSTPRVSQERL